MPWQQDGPPTVVLGVTGSIAAFKAAQLTSNLKKRGYDVHVIMTANAQKLVCPATFETLSGNRVSLDTFERNFDWDVHHISLAKRADVFLVAPATANILAKMAQGLADDMLSTTLLAARCAKVVCPAMNTGMYENPATQRNLQLLAEQGVLVVDAATGLLACGDEGKGRLADLNTIEDAVESAMPGARPLAGRRVLVSAGATREAIDPVRFITNHSSGKMGYATARAARNLGAQVTLVAANTSLPAPFGVQVVGVQSAQDMHDAVIRQAAAADLVVMAAAVADYRPLDTARQKIKKSREDWALPLTRTPDILAELGQTKRLGQLLCGFSMETENLIENATKKLHEKGCDMMVANSLLTEGAGFGTDTNVGVVLTAAGARQLPKMSKQALAREFLIQLSQMF